MSIWAIGQSTAEASAPLAAPTSSSAPSAPASGTSVSSATGLSTSTSASSGSSYTANISSAARALWVEASETSVQTAQEAGKGDQQAQRLLAKDVVAKVH
ncbi:hypothetical protein [Paraburkholderia sp.]|uniref:hypothetical protein n=1 Tax=Paraburkholderia sp. TaxID=1926495 RepID=UPI002AFF117F|nr:hypothetical protein [Paraburkholderia sp.]